MKIHMQVVPWEVSPPVRYSMLNEASTCWSTDMSNAIRDRLRHAHGIINDTANETFTYVAEAGCLIITFDNENA